MILTYKIKHNRDFSTDLKKARSVAEFSILNKRSTSASVKHFGLKSAISNQIIRKYGRNKTIKKVSNVNLIVPGQSVKNDVDSKILHIPCLKLTIPYQFSKFEKVNQIELSKEYAFVSVTINESKQITPVSWVGVDLNTTGHCCVASNPATGKVLKLGKKAFHTHNKYKNQRKKLQKKQKFGMVKKIKNRESRIVRDLNHKISKKVVNYALANNSGIVLEDLKGIRKTKKQVKSFKYSLHSWSFYQLRTFIEYKAKLLGVPVVKIDPCYTSQQCSKCGLLGTRNKKHFKCPTCGHVDNADVNASFSIALRHQGVIQMPTESDVGMSSTGTLQKAIA